MGPRTLHILRTYWFRLQMVAKVKGHYGTVFQSNRGLTQGETFSPNIFNVVSDSVIRHRVTVVGGPQEGTRQGLGTSILTQLDLLYANGVLVASPESARLQGAFDALMGLFGQVGLQTKVGKTVSMACWPCHTPYTWSMEA